MEEHNQFQNNEEQILESEEQKESQLDERLRHQQDELDNDIQESKLSAKNFETEEDNSEFQKKTPTENLNELEESHPENDPIKSSNLNAELSKGLEEELSSETPSEQISLKSSGKASKNTDSQKVSSLSNSNAENKAKTSELNKARLQQLAEELKVEKQKAKQALDAGKVIFNVECCVNCSAHSYCTHHDENKYSNMFAELKQQIEAVNSTFYVAKNLDIPRPRIGAFEIFYKNIQVYSKLSTMQWPKVSILLKRLENLDELGGKENHDEKGGENKGPTEEKSEHKQVALPGANKILNAKKC